MPNPQAVRDANFDKRPISMLLRPLHLALSMRGIVDALSVAFRDPDVFLLQISLWKDGGLKGMYQFRRLRELSRLLAARSVTVIEFGSGASTLLIAKRSRSAVTVEESAVWAKKLSEALRAAWWVNSSHRTNAINQLSVRPRREWQDDHGEWVCGYALPAEISAGSWDIAYVDGPTNWPQDQARLSASSRNMPNADVLTLARLPGEVWVDGRVATLEYLSQNLPAGWTVRTEMHLPRSSRRLFHTMFCAPPSV